MTGMDCQHMTDAQLQRAYDNKKAQAETARIKLADARARFDSLCTDLTAISREKRKRGQA